MHKLSVVVATALALVACSQKSGTTTITSNAETGTTSATTIGNPPTAASLGLQPGKWETTISITDLEMHGVRRAGPQAGGEKVTTCVTPEMAAKGPGEFLKKAGVDCTSTSSSYGGGRIVAQMTCKMPMGTMTSSTTGTYSPTEMTSDAEATITGRMTIREKVHTEARRVGECG
jgi:hypothetical protein